MVNVADNYSHLRSETWTGTGKVVGEKKAGVKEEKEEERNRVGQ